MSEKSNFGSDQNPNLDVYVLWILLVCVVGYAVLDLAGLLPW